MQLIAVHGQHFELSELGKPFRKRLEAVGAQAQMAQRGELAQARRQVGQPQHLQ